MVETRGERLGASGVVGASQRRSVLGAGGRAAEAEVEIETDAGTDTRSCVFGLLLLTAALVALWAVAVTAPAFAAPAITVSDFSVTPSTTTAGADPDVTVSSRYSYSSPTEDLKTAIVNFPPGLLGNPEALPKCSEAELQAAACSPQTQVGTSVFSPFWVGVGPLPPVPGKVYNAELLGGEAGRLGIITPTPFGALISEIPFTVRTATDYGLTGVLDDVPRTLGPLDIQTVGLSFTLEGASNGFVRNPTSCAPATSTGEAIGYDGPTAIGGPPSSFTPTGCDSLTSAQSFAPGVSVSMGDRGTTARDGFPPLRVAISQSAGQPDMAGNTILLPEELNANTAAYDSLCTDAQAAGHSCPADSQVGGARATSPFLGEDLSGPVYMTEQAGQPLPGLLADLMGRVPIQIRVTTKVIDSRIKSTVTGLPQLPISTFNLGLDGGRNGVFTNRSDLCFRSESSSLVKSMKSDVTTSGYNGTNLSAAPAVEVQGCQPGLSTRLTGARGTEPRLRLTVQRHPGAGKIARLKIRLPKGMWLVRSKIDGGVSGRAAVKIGSQSFEVRGRRTLVVRSLPGGSAGKIVVVLDDGAVRVSRNVRNAVRSGKRKRLALRVVSFPASGRFLRSRTTERAAR